MTCIIAPLTILAKQPCSVNNLHSHPWLPCPHLVLKVYPWGPGFLSRIFPYKLHLLPLPGWLPDISRVVMPRAHPTLLLTLQDPTEAIHPASSTRSLVFSQPSVTQQSFMKHLPCLGGSKYSKGNRRGIKQNNQSQSLCGGQTPRGLTPDSRSTALPRCKLRPPVSTWPPPDGFPARSVPTDPGIQHPQLCLSTPPPWGRQESFTLSPWLLFTLPVRCVSTSREMSIKEWRGAPEAHPIPPPRPRCPGRGNLCPRDPGRPVLGTTPNAQGAVRPPPVVLDVGGTQSPTLELIARLGC